MNLSALLTTLEPWKAVLAAALGLVGAAVGLIGGVIKQRGVPDTTSPDQAAAPRPVTFRLHPDDRQLIGDATEAATDLTRAIRHLTGATEDNTVALNRRGGGGGARR